jgi:isoquinoline 1-oxidoreductase beta subunit
MVVCVRPHAYSSEKSTLNAWPYFRIEPDGSVIVAIPRTEIGQGVMTGLAQLVAEELEAEWSQIHVVHAPANAVLFGREQNTVASQSIYDSWETWRIAAASARTMLEIVAAKRWGVSPMECYGSGGLVHHRPTMRTKTFGSLSTEASRAAIPKSPILKTKVAVVGRSLQRIDSFAKCTGRAIFGIDVKLPNSLIAVVLHPPRYERILPPSIARNPFRVVV